MASPDNRLLLLDINVLMALAWPNHQCHRSVVARLDQRLAPPGAARTRLEAMTP